jgi:hypothetical protein
MPLRRPGRIVYNLFLRLEGLELSFIFGTIDEPL